MYAAHGIRIFFRGFTAAMMRAFPLHGIVFLGYEFAMKVMSSSDKLMPPLEL
jgi:mannose/fructose/N-acetylgalactosamine-specific phosphotransferase system component IIC